MAPGPPKSHAKEALPRICRVARSTLEQVAILANPPMSTFVARLILALIAAVGLVPQALSFEAESRTEGETCNSNSDCLGTLSCETGRCRGVAGADDPPPRHAAALPRIIAYADVARSKYQLAHIDEAALADPDTRIKLAFVRSALSRTMEVHIHQMRGASKNRVFVSRDGHSEAVIDENGKQVTDCVNGPSYNYFVVEREPLEHFMFDMLPWIESGNCAFDPTSRGERVAAYLLDFRNGAIRVFNGPPASLPLDFGFNGKGQVEAAALFLRALHETPAAEIAMLYTQSATGADFERWFAQFSRAFAHVFE